MVKCKCGVLNPDDAKYCQECGNALNSRDSKHYLIIIGKTILAMVIVFIIGGILTNWVIGPIFSLFSGG